MGILPKPLSKLEETLALQIKAHKLPEPEREYRFDSRRRYRFDFAWPSLVPPLSVEVEGGTHIRGRHTRPLGFRNDCRKYNLATLRGWRVLRFDSYMVNNGEAIDTIREVLDERK